MRGARALGAVLVSASLSLPGCDADDAELRLFAPNAQSDAGGAGTSSATPCQVDDDCPDSEQRICEPLSLVCVGCVADSDCSQGDRPRCLMPDRICGECASDADCPNADEPGCLLTEHRCRQCSRDAHCPTGQICDADGSCR